MSGQTTPPLEVREAELLAGDCAVLERAAGDLVAQAERHPRGSRRQQALARLARRLLDEARPGPVGAVTFARPAGEA